MMSLSKQIFVAFVMALLLVMATTAFMPATMASDLPPRPTAVPTMAVPTAVPPTVVAPLSGGLIQLQLSTTADTTELWTAVQWQDANKDWHTVEGWQGAFSPAGVVTWWVASADFGTGPFHWQLLEGEGGSLLTVSEAFYLPEGNGQVVVVTVEN